MTPGGENWREQRRIGVNDAQALAGMRRNGDHPVWPQRPPMRRLAGPFLGQMDPMQTVRQDRIIRSQKNQTARFGKQGFRQSMAACGIPCAKDHHAALGQAARRPHRIGEAFVIGHQNQEARIEAAEVSC